MVINEQLISILKEYRININDAICYLMALYYGYKPTYIPDNLKQKVNMTGILNMDKHGTVQWVIPLFDNQVTAFAWVEKEYLKLFAPFKKDNKFKRECTARMKKLFSLHQEIRKDEILGATDIYIKQCQREGRANRMVKSPHYFIEEGKGLSKVNMILSFIDMYRVATQEDEGSRTSLSTKMQ